MQDPEYELDFVTVLKELDEHVFNGFVELFVNSGQSNPMRFTISGATDITVRFALGDVTERKVFDRVGVAVVGIRDKLIHDVALESIAISFSPYLISFYVVLTLYNPLSTDFTLSNVSYSVYFDDMDGVPIPFFYPPKEHIKLTEVKDDVPKYLPALSTVDTEVFIQTSSTELAIRVANELSNNNFYIDILDGTMNVTVAVFQSQVNFEITHIKIEN